MPGIGLWAKKNLVHNSPIPAPHCRRFVVIHAVVSGDSIATGKFIQRSRLLVEMPVAKRRWPVLPGLYRTMPVGRITLRQDSSGFWCLEVTSFNNSAEFSQAGDVTPSINKTF